MIYKMLRFKMFVRQNDKKHPLLMSPRPLQNPKSPRLSAMYAILLWTYSDFFNRLNYLYLPSLLCTTFVSSVKQEFKSNRGPILTIYFSVNWAKPCSFLPLWSALCCIINSFKHSQFAELLKPLCSVDEALNNQHCVLPHRLTKEKTEKKKKTHVNAIFCLMFLPADTILRWDD